MFSLIKEASDHFVIQDNQSGQQKAIAKDALPGEWHQKLRQLPKVQKFQEGGEIEEPTPIPTPEPTIQDYDPTFDVTPPPTEYALPPPAQSPTPYSVPGDSMVQEPEAPPVEPQFQDVAPPEPPQKEAPPDQFAKDLNQAYSDRAKAIYSLGAAQAQGAEQMATMYKNQQEQLTQAYQIYTKSRDEEMAKIDKMREDVANQKIDPNRYWAQASGVKGAARKVLSLIGLVLGGGAQMRTGVNPAAQTIDAAIREDLESQKQNIDSQRGLLRQEYEKYGNIHTAWNSAQLQMTNMFQAQLQQVANSTQSQTIKLQANQAVKELEMQRQEQLQQLAMTRAIEGLRGRAMGFGAAPISPQEYAALQTYDPKTAKEMIRVPSGDPSRPFDMVHVPNEKIRDSMSESLPVINQINALLNESDQAINKYGRGLLPLGDVRDRGKRIQAQIKLLMKDLGKSSLRIGEFTDDKYLNNIVHNPASLQPRQALEANQSLRNLLHGKVTSYLSTGATSYNPGAQQLELRSGLAENAGTR